MISKVTAKIAVVFDKTAKISEALALLGSKRVMVGVPQEDAQREDGAPFSNAAIGYINETGAPDINLPARPHLVPGVKSVQKETVQMLAVAGRLALSGDVGAVDRQLNRVGLLNQNAVRAKVRAGLVPELSQRTLQGRRDRGRTGTLPLLDTGQYLRSIVYVVRG